MQLVMVIKAVVEETSAEAFEDAIILEGALMQYKTVKRAKNAVHVSSQVTCSEIVQSAIVKPAEERVTMHGVQRAPITAD